MEPHFEQFISRLEADTRDIHAVTPNAGLMLLGPSLPDGNAIVSLAHNAAMAG